MRAPVVRTTLASAFPGVVLRGPDLVQIYNDTGLGIPTRACWPEAWEFNAPIYERVRRGETVAFDDVLIPIGRYGAVADAWFTISYSPLWDDGREIGGVLVTLLEATARVAARRLEAERERLVEQLKVERTQLGEVFRQAPAFLAVLRGRDHAFALANDAYLDLVGRCDMGGRPVAEALPEVKEQGFIDLLEACSRPTRRSSARRCPCASRARPARRPRSGS